MQHELLPKCLLACHCWCTGSPHMSSVWSETRAGPCTALLVFWGVNRFVTVDKVPLKISGYCKKKKRKQRSTLHGTCSDKKFCFALRRSIGDYDINSTVDRLIWKRLKCLKVTVGVRGQRSGTSTDTGSSTRINNQKYSSKLKEVDKSLTSL